MEIIIAYILGILTVFFIGIAVGVFMVMRRTTTLEKKMNSIQIDLSHTSDDLYTQLDIKHNDVLREIDRIERATDSKLNKLETKLSWERVSPPDTKTLLKG